MRTFIYFSILMFLLTESMTAQELCRPSRVNGSSQDAGPVSYIFEGAQDSVIQACLQDFSPDSLHSFILQLQSFQTRFCFAQNSREVAFWIRDRFQYYGCDEAVIDSFYLVDTYLGDTLKGWQYNVIGTIYGDQSPGLEYLMGGHHDAIVWNNGNSFVYAPGADDNGTSIAAIFESLRVMKKHGFRPGKTIRFTGWAAEELGLHGSEHYALHAAGRGDSILFYFNMDMIGNESKNSEWKVVFYQYDKSEAGTAVCSYITQNHTLLEPEVIIDNARGSDSYSFYKYGYPAVFVQEDEFSPFYHKPSDVDTNLNYLYFRETAAATCGSLMWISMSPSPVSVAVKNPGNGATLLVHWNRVPESDLSHYNIYIGTSPGVYTRHLTTSDTLMEVDGLMTDSLYYIGVAAENTSGMQGMVTEVADIAALVTFEHGVLIVEDSYGADPDVPDSLVRLFYENICAKYDYAFYQAYESQKADLSLLGKYKAVLWNINKSITNTVLQKSRRDVENYLGLGGNILFTLYTPSKAFEDNTKYPAYYGPGDFIFDAGHTDTVWHNNGSAFIGAYPVAAGYPVLDVDSAKTSPTTYYHLLRIEGIHPAGNASVIYGYNTGFDTTTVPGRMKHKPVGIEYIGSNHTMIMTSFPLYYIMQEQCMALVDYIFKDKFGVYPAAVESCWELAGVALHPNPAADRFVVSMQLKEEAMVTVTVSTLLGQPVKSPDVFSGCQGMNRFPVPAGDLRPGLYLVSVRAGEHLVMKKLIIERQ